MSRQCPDCGKNMREIRLIDKEPRIGAGGAKIAFVHPSATGGVLVEICERTAGNPGAEE